MVVYSSGLWAGVITVPCDPAFMPAISATAASVLGESRDLPFMHALTQSQDIASVGNRSSRLSDDLVVPKRKFETYMTA